MDLITINHELSLEDVLSSRGRIKIIETLILNEEINISEIIKLTGLNHKTTKQHLNYLIMINFVQEKKFGRIRIYRFKLENINARALRNLVYLWRK